MSHTVDSVTLRMATPADALPLLRLAQLDSSVVPAAPVLLAERDGRLLAARSLSTKHSVADPFTPTGDIVRLLAAHAEQLDVPRRPLTARRLRVLAPRPG